MSSLRLNESPQEQPRQMPTWFKVEAAEVACEPDARPAGIVLSLQARRKGLADGKRREVTVDVINDFGDGDAESARAIESDMDSRWDA